MEEKLIQKSMRLVQGVDMSFVRDIYDEIDFSQRLIGIVGQRGVGKTTLILQHLQQRKDLKSVYVSADNVQLVTMKLYELVEEMYYTHGIRLIAIDEIHKYQNWNQELKNIYDDFPQLQIVFSGSSSIDLLKGRYDLSRRLTLYTLEGFSLREYINKTRNLSLPKLSLTSILENHEGESRKIYSVIGDDILNIYSEYLQKGYYPFVFESEYDDVYYKKLLGAIDKMIYEDISNFYRLETQNLEKLRKIVIFYAFSEPGEMSINALKNKIGLAYDTTLSYLEILSEIGLLRAVSSYGSISVSLRKAKKIFVSNTNLLSAFHQQTNFILSSGTLREVFFVNQFSSHIFIPSDNQGDFFIQYGDVGYNFEVGGKNKTHKQLQGKQNAFIVKDNTLLGYGNSIPLWLFGFLR